jgi:hypothetical protein
MLARPITRIVSPMPGDEKQQRDARIADDIAQGVDAVVAAAIGNEQSFLVRHPHETRRVAARRAIEPIRPAGRQRKERRRLDEFAIMRIDAIDLFDDGWAIRFAVKRFERRQRGHAITALFHNHLPVIISQ